jgi:serine/threonine protein kinase
MAPGDYEEGEEIGKGKFGVVFRGFRRSDNLPVAIKHLPPFGTKADTQRFLREIQIPANCRHPTILPLYAFSLNSPNNSTGPSIVTALCPHGSLGSITSAIWKNEPLPSWFSPVRAAIALYGSARALQFLHSREIIHRDVKPDNILFGENWRPYLADFGFARPMKSDDTAVPLDMTGGIGTPLLMAPELFGDKGYTKAVDVFAFAVTAWMVFADRCVGQFDDGTCARKVCDYIAKVEKGARLVKPARCPDCWWGVITAAWNHVAERRPSAGEIADKLDAPEFAIEFDRVEEYTQYVQEIKAYRPPTYAV